jgi:hypothetical protein
MVRDDSKWKRVAELYEHEIDSKLMIRVSVNESTEDGHRLIDVRQFWRHSEEEHWMPSKRGISMPFSEWEVVAAIISSWLDDNG